MTNTLTKINAATYEAKLIREPLKVRSDDWQETAHKWLVVINGQSFDYYTGLAHREELKNVRGSDIGEYKRLRNANPTARGLSKLLRLSKATPPTISDILYSLVTDASAESESFPDWCANLGYDTDSRKALETYLACQENAVKLRKCNIAPLAELVEHFNDY
jgi:hypothetical protein